MKLISVLILFPIFMSAQIKQKYDWKRAIAPSSLSFVAGASWGLHETLQHHNDRFFRVFPGASKRYWGVDCWKNKYEDPWYIPTQISDGLHLSATTHHVALFGAGITIGIGKKRPFWHYCLDAGLSLASYSLGNYLVYDVIFHK